MNRLDRISALLVQLQSRSVVKAAEMAERFGVSMRTIYRDIRTLEEAGVHPTRSTPTCCRPFWAASTTARSSIWTT